MIPGISSSKSDGSNNSRTRTDAEYSSIRPLADDDEDNDEEDQLEEALDQEEGFADEVDSEEDDHDGGTNGENYDENQAGGFSRPPSSRRRKARRHPMQHGQPDSPSSGGLVFCLWVLLMVLLLLVVFGLLLFRHRNYYNEAMDIARNQTNNSNRDKDHNGGYNNYDDDMNGSPNDDDAPILPTESQANPLSHSSHNKPHLPEKHSYTVHYDAMPHNWDPFGLNAMTTKDDSSSHQEESGNWLDNPSLMLPWMNQPVGNYLDDDDNSGYYYAMQPNIVNSTMVFVTEGDLYLTRLVLDNDNTNNGVRPAPALKLTTTVGNVRTPVLHPTLPLVAFTATYTGRREVYVQDFRAPRQPAKQVTYWGFSDYGVSGVVGWKNDHTLLLAAPSMAVSLPDTRLYEMTLATTTHAQSTSGAATPTPLQITPVPLSQALNGVYDNDDDDMCLFFTRFSQSSQTVRYVGGTAESLWVYCDGQELALALTGDYNGTSKLPSLYSINVPTRDDPVKFLLFLSDRQWNAQSQSWYPTSMNLWALVLPKETTELYRDTHNNAVSAISLPPPIQLTQISCHFDGRSLREYSVDPVTKNIVLRVGANVYTLRRKQVRSQLLQQLQEATPRTEPPSLPRPTRIPLHVYSDFHETQERLIPLKISKHFKGVDVFEGASGNAQALLTVRGQTWVSPVMPENGGDGDSPPISYQGSGQFLPERTYRLAPGSLTGGAMRVLMTRAVPLPAEPDESQRRMAVVLATDPKSPTAEHAFYLVESEASAANVFNDLDHLPEPFLGGGAEGGLGSIHAEDVIVSPCGRRMAWTDTNGRICVMNLPLYSEGNATISTAAANKSSYTVLPTENELGEPLKGLESQLLWSPGGRYLSITHFANNRFYVISIVDCGDPTNDISIGRVVQATPSRFNSMDAFWGISRADAALEKRRQQIDKIHGKTDDAGDNEDDYSSSATTLYFLTDRDVMTDTSSPWGSRMPLPHFSESMVMYALPLPVGDESSLPIGRFSSGGAMEVKAEPLALLDAQIKQLEESDDDEPDVATNSSDGMDVGIDGKDDKSKFPKDRKIHFGPKDLTFARRAYRMAHIPKDDYTGILSQTTDGSFVLVSRGDSGVQLSFFESLDGTSDNFDSVSVSLPTLKAYELSTCRNWVSLVRLEGVVQVVQNSLSQVISAAKDSKVGRVDSEQIGLSVWPALEYHQMYNDAWRMLRDYFYDKDLHQVDWKSIHQRYFPLVKRCTKREELDDILSQMAAELSALHVFVYGGEYSSPFAGEIDVANLHQPASLGVSLQRTSEWKGYKITEMALRDPDYNLLEGSAVYSPLSDQALRPSGQKGLQVGDVIVGINGESVFRAPDIHMLLRGKAGQSVRLEVLRLASGAAHIGSSDVSMTLEEASPEPVVVVPIDQDDASELRYNAWEYHTRQEAKDLAKDNGFSVGYVHLRSMSREDMDAFARSYFEDFDKEAMVLDLRHNRGGNIDSWISAFLQRKPWSYFGDRTGNKGTDLHWNQHFAFRGHLVVLIDEKTSSDGEGMARSVSELELGYLIGKRTWGGGIWLASDNKLVDGGIATAPEDGVYNENWGWGMGIEQQGVKPDEEVDNNPRTSFDGKDSQLERAIHKLKNMLNEDPVVQTSPPPQKPDMSLKGEQCGT